MIIAGRGIGYVEPPPIKSTPTYVAAVRFREGVRHGKPENMLVAGSKITAPQKMDLAGEQSLDRMETR